VTTPIRNLSDDVFLGQYCRPLDGMRLCIPSEWARVFRDGGGVVAVEHPNGNLVLTTKERAESAPDVELSKVVLCKMDARGRMTIPATFRSLFEGLKDVEMVGMANYVEVRGI
jgi:DNA-binding transcriptional regulator/RsmH inhibitor MraZ